MLYWFENLFYLAVMLKIIKGEHWTGYVDLLDFHENGLNVPQISHRSALGFNEIWNISLSIYRSLTSREIQLTIYFLSNQWEYRNCLTLFVSPLSAEWCCPVCFKVWSNMEASNSVKQTLSMLHLNAYIHVPTKTKTVKRFCYFHNLYFISFTVMYIFLRFLL